MDIATGSPARKYLILKEVIHEKKNGGILGFLVMSLAGNSALAQYDMRNPNNPYAGIGRTGFALEDRSKAL